MTVAWPATVPEISLADGLSESPGDNMIRSPMDVGPAKVRRRGTSAVRSLTWRQNLTTAQIANLDTFIATTTQYGTISFTRAHPRTGATVTVRFLKPLPSYVFVPNSAGRWLVTFNCEVLP